MKSRIPEKIMQGIATPLPLSSIRQAPFDRLRTRLRQAQEAPQDKFRAEGEKFLEPADLKGDLTGEKSSSIYG